MNRKEIESEYKVVDGVIRNPGKFEGEPVYAVYFYDAMLNGFSDESDEKIDQFYIRDEDIVEFPELNGDKLLTLWTDDSGFVHTETV